MENKEEALINDFTDVNGFEGASSGMVNKPVVLDIGSGVVEQDKEPENKEEALINDFTDVNGFEGASSGMVNKPVVLDTKNNTTVQIEEPENNPVDSQSQQPAIIKMEGKPVNSPTQTASEKDGNNNLQEKVQSVVSNLQKEVESHNDKIKVLKVISKRLANKIERISKVEQDKVNELVKENGIDWNKVENPCKLLSEEFRIGNKRPTLGLETVASRVNDSFNFNIIGTRNRDDLAPFIGLTISIKGLEDNKTLTDFVSAIGVVGFQKAVEYVNSLGNGNKVELVLFDDKGNKIEDQKKLDTFKAVTVPTSNSFTMGKNKKMILGQVVFYRRSIL